MSNELKEKIISDINKNRDLAFVAMNNNLETAIGLFKNMIKRLSVLIAIFTATSFASFGHIDHYKNYDYYLNL